MPNNLPELRDIHIPQNISDFPQGYGWSVLFFLCVFGWLLYKIARYGIAKSKKRYAIKLMQQLSPDNIQKSASSMSEILRRVCVYKYPEALVLSGYPWIDFLQSHSKTKIDEKTSRLLIDAPYMPADTKSYDVDTLQKLKKFCIRWIGENL